MHRIEAAIEAAYQAQIASLYKVLSDAILMANNDQKKIAHAEVLFSIGLDFAEDVYNRARSAASLNN